MSERRSPELTFGDRQAGENRRRESERSFRDRGRERDGVSQRNSSESTFGDRQAGEKVTESKNDTHLAYKQYVERRDSRASGKCSNSCHKNCKDSTFNKN